MHRTPLFLAIAMSAGCTTQDTLHMEMMSMMESETRGVVLYPDGQRGHAAMWDTTCEFDTLNGWLIEDHDLPTDLEVVQDQFHGRVLGRSDEGVHIVQDRDADVALHDVVHGRLLHDDGLALVRDTPEGCLVELEGTVSVVDDGLCDPGARITVDRSGELFAATGDEVYRVTKSGPEHLWGDADLVVYDRAAEMVYAARTGGSTVTGLLRDGTVRWETELDGEITSLDDMGDRGNALVMIVDEKGGGSLVVIQGASGEIVTDHETPSGDGEIVVSEDGRTLGIVMPSTVYFYDITADGEDPKARRTYGSPDPTFLD